MNIRCTQKGKPEHEDSWTISFESSLVFPLEIMFIIFGYCIDRQTRFNILVTAKVYLNHFKSIFFDRNVVKNRIIPLKEEDFRRYMDTYFTHPLPKSEKNSYTFTDTDSARYAFTSLYWNHCNDIVVLQGILEHILFHFRSEELESPTIQRALDIYLLQLENKGAKIAQHLVTAHNHIPLNESKQSIMVWSILPLFSRAIANRDKKKKDRSPVFEDWEEYSLEKQYDASYWLCMYVKTNLSMYSHDLLYELRKITKDLKITLEQYYFDEHQDFDRIRGKFTLLSQMMEIVEMKLGMSFDSDSSSTSLFSDDTDDDYDDFYPYNE